MFLVHQELSVSHEEKQNLGRRDLNAIQDFQGEKNAFLSYLLSILPHMKYDWTNEVKRLIEAKGQCCV